MRITHIKTQIALKKVKNKRKEINSTSKKLKIETDKKGCEGRHP